MDHCKNCAEKNVNDSLTPDGLCFECDVEKIEFVVAPECFNDIVEKYAIHNAQGRDKGQAN